MDENQPRSWLNFHISLHRPETSATGIWLYCYWISSATQWKMIWTKCVAEFALVTKKVATRRVELWLCTLLSLWKAMKDRQDLQFHKKLRLTLYSGQIWKLDQLRGWFSPIQDVRIRWKSPDSCVSARERFLDTRFCYDPSSDEKVMAAWNLGVQDPGYDNQKKTFLYLTRVNGKD